MEFKAIADEIWDELPLHRANPSRILKTPIDLSRRFVYLTLCEKMHLRRTKIFGWASVGLFCVGTSTTLFAGEKIQFDIPTDREDRIQVEQRPRSFLPPVSNNAGPGAAASAPSSQPIARPVAPRVFDKNTQDELDKKRNWLSADPSKSQSAEDAFNVKDFSSSEEREDESDRSFLQKNDTFLGQSLEKSPSPGTMRSRLSRDMNEQPMPSSIFPRAETGSWERAWDLSDSAKQFNTGLDIGEDFWGTKGTSFSGGDLQKRQNSFLEGFGVARQETRNNTGLINTFLDNSRTAVNPVEGVGAGAFDQKFQTSFTDQWKGAVSPTAINRPNFMEDNRPKIASPTPIAAPADLNAYRSTWVKPQPATLKFPSRPGELFK